MQGVQPKQGGMERNVSKQQRDQGDNQNENNGNNWGGNMNLVMVEGIITMVGGDITKAEEMIINQNGDINQVLLQG
jgi:hypothetical protein